MPLVPARTRFSVGLSAVLCVALSAAAGCGGGSSDSGTGGSMGAAGSAGRGGSAGGGGSGGINTALGRAPSGPAGIAVDTRAGT